MKLLPIYTYRHHKEHLRYIYQPRVYGWEGVSHSKFLTLKSFKNTNTLHPYIELTREKLLRNIDGIQYFK